MDIPSSIGRGHLDYGADSSRPAIIPRQGTSGSPAGRRGRHGCGSVAGAHRAKSASGGRRHGCPKRSWGPSSQEGVRPGKDRRFPVQRMTLARSACMATATPAAARTWGAYQWGQRRAAPCGGGAIGLRPRPGAGLRPHAGCVSAEGVDLILSNLEEIGGKNRRAVATSCQSGCCGHWLVWSEWPGPRHSPIACPRV